MDQNDNRPSDEISLYELVVSASKLISLIKRHFIGLALFSILGIIGASFYVYTGQPQYNAKLTFILNDQNNPRISGAGSILSQFGLPVQSGSYNVDKLLKISESRHLITNALFTKSVINNKDDFLANHFIDIYDLNTRWKDKFEDLGAFHFQHTDTDSFQIEEKYALKSLYSLIVGTSGKSNGLLATDYGKSDYIMSFTLSSLNEKLSIDFVKVLYNKVASFYFSQTIEPKKAFLAEEEKKMDSINNVLIRIRREIAMIDDQNIGVVRSRDLVRQRTLKSQELGLSAALVKGLEALNAAKLSVQSSTELIQLLDEPLGPLNPAKRSYIKYGLWGLGLGVFLYTLLCFLSAAWNHQKRISSL